jgi:hypothetical protein
MFCLKKGKSKPLPEKPKTLLIAGFFLPVFYDKGFAMLLIKLILNRDLTLGDLKKLAPGNGSNFILMPDKAPDCYLASKFKFNTAGFGAFAKARTEKVFFNYHPDVNSMGVPNAKNSREIPPELLERFHEDVIDEAFTEETAEQHVNIAFQLILEHICKSDIASQLVFIPYENGEPVFGNTEVIKTNIDNLASQASRVLIYNIDDALLYVKGGKVASQTRMPKPVASKAAVAEPLENKEDKPQANLQILPPTPPLLPLDTASTSRMFSPSSLHRRLIAAEQVVDSDDEIQTEAKEPQRRIFCCFKR